MKKAKFLTLALVVAIMMVGAGYAYWSETLTANIEVTTGELDIVIDPESTTATAIDDDGNPIEDEYLGEVKATVNEETRQEVEFVAEKLYPGRDVELTCTVVNNGTLPAVLKGVAIKDLVLPEIDGIQPGHIKLEPKVTDRDGNTISPLRAFVVGVGEEYTLTITTGLKGEEITGDLYEDQSLSFTMELKYGQHNDNSGFEVDIPQDFPFDLGL